MLDVVTGIDVMNDVSECNRLFERGLLTRDEVNESIHDLIFDWDITNSHMVWSFPNLFN